MKQLHFFKAHDQAVKCAAMDSNEEFLVTGSVAGDIKVCSISLQSIKNLKFSFFKKIHMVFLSDLEFDYL